MDRLMAGWRGCKSEEHVSEKKRLKARKKETVVCQQVAGQCACLIYPCS